LRPQAQATLKAASAAYQTDQTDFLNLIDSQNTALDVEYSYYRALADFDSRVAELEGAIGAAIPRDSIARAEAKHETKGEGMARCGSSCRLADCRRCLSLFRNCSRRR